jgi:YHS domain-containing protein
MQSDPVSGEMVMSEAYHFDLKNGQRLRFAEQNTLTQFLHDPVRFLYETCNFPIAHMMLTVPCFGLENWSESRGIGGRARGQRQRR